MKRVTSRYEDTWIMEALRRRERQVLEERRKLQLRERRARRHRDREVEQRKPLDAAATTLAEMEAVTARAGFVRQQLAVTGLTPLRRWRLQLQLLVAGDVEMQPAVAGADDVDTALRACEETLSRDQRCFDVVYRDGGRVPDARESLLERSNTHIREVLSFSTRCDGSVCRVTCVNDGKRVLFSSSGFVEDLQNELERLLAYEESIDAAITFLSKALNR